MDVASKLNHMLSPQNSEAMWQKFDAKNKWVCRKLWRWSVIRLSDFMRPPAARQIQSQALILQRINSQDTHITTRYLSEIHQSRYWSAAGGWWITEADALTGGTSNGGRVLHRTDQTRPSNQTPPTRLPSLPLSLLLIRVILTVMHKSLQHRAGWLAGNATDPPRVEEWGIKHRKTPP